MDKRGCMLIRNSSGLYDVQIYDGNRIIEVIRNVTFHKAVVIMEDQMYCNSERKDE